VKRDGSKNIVASVQARLVERSRELGVEHQLTLARFGGERLLYRLSQSEFADGFILKGAVLLLLWLGEPIRPTKDVDLLGFGDTSADALKRVFVELCAIESPEDGLTFLPDSVHVEAIREVQEYGGMRVKLMAMLGTVRIPLQVDVGAGDAVVPPPELLDYPGLLDLPRARIRAYRPETSIAEKAEAMVRLALANSRMKDFLRHPSAGRNANVRRRDVAAGSRGDVQAQGNRDPRRTSDRIDQGVRGRCPKEDPMGRIRSTCTTARACGPVGHNCDP
jgi:hypothetical protein